MEKHETSTPKQAALGSGPLCNNGAPIEENRNNLNRRASYRCYCKTLNQFQTLKVDHTVTVYLPGEKITCFYLFVKHPLCLTFFFLSFSLFLSGAFGFLF